MKVQAFNGFSLKTNLKPSGDQPKAIAELLRKEKLVEYGWRLPSALDNRPLKFEEFLQKINHRETSLRP